MKTQMEVAKKVAPPAPAVPYSTIWSLMELAAKLDEIAHAGAGHAGDGKKDDGKKDDGKKDDGKAKKDAGKAGKPAGKSGGAKSGGGKAPKKAKK